MLTAFELVQGLSDKSSAKRRSAAKKLRKLKLPAFGPAILQSIEQEIRDPRTWETQYQMIMALAESDYTAAVPFLETLISRPLTPMVMTAIGDALIRLNDCTTDASKRVSTIMSSGNVALTEGAVRAVAMLRLKLSPAVIRQIIEFASHPENEQVRFWIAAAAPGWEGPEVEKFLHECLTAKLAETRKAAKAALQKKYLKWFPL